VQQWSNRYEQLSSERLGAGLFVIPLTLRFKKTPGCGVGGQGACDLAHDQSYERMAGGNPEQH
jgi:hypothetical protein